MNRTATPAIVIMVWLFLLSACTDNRHSKTANPETAHSTNQSSVLPHESLPPEAVLREFMTAVIRSDELQVKKFAVPHPEIDALWSKKIPESQVDMAVGLLEQTPITRLEIGDEIMLPSGNRLVVEKKMINDSQVLLTMRDNPLPFVLIKKDGRWLVNAETIISTRKAAQDLENSY